MTTPDGGDIGREDPCARISRLKSETDYLLEENRRLRETAESLRQAARALARIKLGGPID